MSTTILQLHKRDSYEYKFIQDKYAINPKKKVFALADGTTQSFKSEIWAELITRNFINKTTFIPIELISNLSKSVEQYNGVNFEFSSNPAKASLEKTKQAKGGTATFIGLQFSENNKVNVISCGDSNLFVYNSKNLISSFPYSDIESLDSNNYFLNSIDLIKGNIDEKFFNQKIIDIVPGDNLILATDALSRLILQKPEVFNELIILSDFESFHNFCLKYWESKELQEDDISAIIINIEETSHLKIIHPPNNFSFPKKNEEEFKPTQVTEITSIKFNDMQMQEIRNQFNGVAHDFFEVKKKIKLISVLLMSALSLILLCLLFIFWFRPIDHQKTNKASENLIIKTLEKKNKNLESDIKSLKKQLRSKTSQIQELTKPVGKEEKK
ncbi:MAG: hypothetical protein K9I95_14055 [Flavobacteriaceae bacterium]|nr:hypothetical protein [Flavobacteriaceae bacterium]